MDQSFLAYKNDSKRSFLMRTGRVFSLIGIPMVLGFAVLDASVVGLSATTVWRVCGIAPLVAFLAIHVVSVHGPRLIGGSVFQGLGAAILLGINTMMVALLFKALTSAPTIGTVGLAGTVAGNLVVLFVSGLLRGLHPRYATIALCLPYGALLISMAFFADLSPSLWLLVGNAVAALALVIAGIWLWGRQDDERLLALYELGKERSHLEEMVSERTGELEIAVQELDHLVRNTLQMILSLIVLYDKDWPGRGPDAKLRMVQLSVQVLAKVYDLTHSDKVSDTVSTREFLRSLCSTQIWDGQHVEMDSDDMFLDAQHATILGLILVLLVSSSKGCCRVRFSAAPEHYTLSVSVGEAQVAKESEESAWPEGAQSFSSDDLNMARQLAIFLGGSMEAVRQDDELILRLSVRTLGAKGRPGVEPT